MSVHIQMAIGHTKMAISSHGVATEDPGFWMIHPAAGVRRFFLRPFVRRVDPARGLTYAKLNQLIADTWRLLEELCLNLLVGWRYLGMRS